ncbi:tryptophan synthase subunit alpha [Edaphobacter aggregans]|uniref:tryptophan synthase subunit alpha n=1 Tax=Edaphobacter aggregans TaxID=570835 RepID=UPI0009FD6E90
MAIEFKKKPGIVVYLTAGDPDLATTRDIALAAIDNGADVIELGVPFSDPLADGPVIQRASERAVAKGVRLTDVLEVAKELRKARPTCGLVLFSYLNPVIRMGKLKANYRETIITAAEGKGRYVRQTGGKGNFGHADIRIEPNRSGKGYEFSSDIKAGTIPEEYIRAINEGIQEAMKGGVLAGNEMVDIKVSLKDASYHEIDSNEMAFKIAGSMAFKEAARKARPILLEPVAGMQSFCAAAADAGVDGVLLTDMIVEEAGEYLWAMHANGLAPVFLAAPTSTDARLKAIAAASEGFVYAISRLGITGTQQNVAGDAAELVGRLRQFTKLPVAVGFGISTPEHVKAVGEFADAAVVGSAIVQLIEKTAPEQAAAAVGRFVAGLRA